MLKGRKAAAVLAAALIAASFAGCGLLPEEEAAPTPPLIRSYDKVEYVLATVERGDVVSSQRVTFKYAPARRLSLGFEVEGVSLAGVYVTAGDEVTEGALLAELDDGGISDSITAQQQLIESYEANITKLTRDRDLDLKVLDTRIAASPSNEQLKASRKSTKERYDADIEANTLRLAAARTKLDELKASLEQRKLYAPFDGTVTYVKNIKTNDYRSSLTEPFFTISDKTTMTFSAERTKTNDLFKESESVELNINGESYPATITSITDNTIFLVPDEYIPNVSEGSYGNVSVPIEASYDVLRVPSSAVKSANGIRLVYTLEDGVRTMREVVVGLEVDGYSEIISGLSEGEQVVAQ